MKPLSIITALFLVLSLSSCKKSLCDYSIKGIIETTDWEGTDKSLVVRKKIQTNKLISIYTNSSDSVDIFFRGGSINEIKNLPNSELLSRYIHKFIIDSKYKCKNTATFKPIKLTIINVKEVLPHEPTEEEYTIFFEENYGFMKSNIETYIKRKNEMIEEARKGTPKHIALYLDFLASNAYGTPGELMSGATIINNKYNFDYVFD